MLPPAEQSLADRDPDLPGLALLLDCDRLTRWLGSLLGRPVTVRRHHLRYKPGTSCVLHVEAGGRPLLVAATARSEAAKHAKTLELSAGSIIGTDPGRQVLVGTPAADRDLPAVALLADPAHRERLLGRLLRHGPVVDRSVAPTLLRYKPHRRWVGLLPTATGGQVLLRVQRPAATQAAAHTLAALADAAPRTPQLLGCHPRRGALAAEYLPGTTAQEAPVDTAAQVGRALAALHQHPGRVLPELGRDVEVEQVRAAADQLAVLLPDLADRAHHLADQIAAEMAGPGQQHSCVHGDFSLDQAVIGPDGQAGLIDLDAAGLGDPAADLGCAAAAMTRDVLLGHRTETDQQHRLAALHQGYAAAGGPARADRVRVHTAAHLLRLTAEPFRLGQSAAWPDAAAGLLTRAENVAAERDRVRT
ncbi:MAG TPA: phosphotransferase [Ruania sp.]|nr:phosphotransferase [Ruania sp.]